MSTLSERILGAPAGGRYVDREVDIAFAHDGTGVLTREALREMGGWSTSRTPTACAWSSTTSSRRTPGRRRRSRPNSGSMPGPRGGSRSRMPEGGICHQVMSEGGVVRPGTIVSAPTPIPAPSVPSARSPPGGWERPIWRRSGPRGGRRGSRPGDDRGQSHRAALRSCGAKGRRPRLRRRPRDGRGGDLPGAGVRGRRGGGRDLHGRAADPLEHGGRDGGGEDGGDVLRRRGHRPLSCGPRGGYGIAPRCRRTAATNGRSRSISTTSCRSSRFRTGWIPSARRRRSRARTSTRSSSGPARTAATRISPGSPGSSGGEEGGRPHPSLPPPRGRCLPGQSPPVSSPISWMRAASSDRRGAGRASGACGVLGRGRSASPPPTGTSRTGWAWAARSTSRRPQPPQRARLPV